MLRALDYASTDGVSCLGATRLFENGMPRTDIFCIRKGLDKYPFAVETFAIKDGWVKINSEIFMDENGNTTGGAFFFDHNGDVGINWFPIDKIMSYKVSGTIVGVNDDRSDMLYDGTCKTYYKESDLGDNGFEKEDVMGSIPNIEHYGYSYYQSYLLPCYWDMNYPQRNPPTASFNPHKVVQLSPLLVPVFDVDGRMKWFSSCSPIVGANPREVFTILAPGPREVKLKWWQKILRFLHLL